jgi:hypothetical protein
MSLRTSEKYKKYLNFLDHKDVAMISDFWLYFAIISLYVITMLSIDKLLLIVDFIYKAIGNIIQYIPQQASQHFDDSYYLKNFSQTLLDNFVIPLKTIFFLLALIILVIPIFRSVVCSFSKFDRSNFRRIFFSSGVIFFALSLLIFPYGYGVKPYGFHHILGTSGMGIGYAKLSLSPFASEINWYYRRILKPAAAYFLHLNGNLLYYIFSLFCTFALIFLLVFFLESKGSKVDINAKMQKKRFEIEQFLLPAPRILAYGSLCTGGFVMTDFLWPGMVDQVTFSLILLMSFVSTSLQARMALIALCMLNHEMSSLALIPIITFCFPKKDFFKAFSIIALYFFVWLSMNSFSVDEALSANSSKTSIDMLWVNPILIMMGIFSAYKLFWIIFCVIQWKLFKKGEFHAAIVIMSLVFVPFLTMGLMCDLTRGISYGFLGIAVSSAIFWDGRLDSLLTKANWTTILFLINIFIPSYPIVSTVKSTLILVSLSRDICLDS